MPAHSSASCPPGFPTWLLPVLSIHITKEGSPGLSPCASCRPHSFLGPQFQGLAQRLWATTKRGSNRFLLPSERLESVPGPCPGHPSKMDRSRVEGISDLFSCSFLTAMRELAGTCEQSCPLVSCKGHAGFSKKSLRVLKTCKIIKSWRECLFLSFLPLSPRLFEEERKYTAKER